MISQGKDMSAKEFAALSGDEVQQLQRWFRGAWKYDMKLWLKLQEKKGFPEKMKKKQMQNMQNVLKEDERNLITIWEYTKQQNIGTNDDEPDRYLEVSSASLSGKPRIPHSITQAHKVGPRVR